MAGASSGSIIYLGAVKSLDDPDGLGRIQVELHGFTKAFKLPWIRTVQPTASKEHGTVWLPEVGDEVLVLRGEGDAADSMFVLGALYTGKTKPQVKSDKEKNVIKQIMTKEKHKLIFDDTPGKGKITVITGDEKVKIELDVKESSVKIHSEKLVYIETKDAKIKASNLVDIECKDANIKASGKVTIKGTSKVSIIVGGNKVELSAGGIVIKGSMVKIN